jgi:hypothetical protein
MCGLAQESVLAVSDDGVKQERMLRACVHAVPPGPMRMPTGPMSRRGTLSSFVHGARFHAPLGEAGPSVVWRKSANVPDDVEQMCYDLRLRRGAECGRERAQEG